MDIDLRLFVFKICKRLSFISVTLSLSSPIVKKLYSAGSVGSFLPLEPLAFSKGLFLVFYSGRLAFDLAICGNLMFSLF
jgi:hypothetical protein